jgi:Fe-S cluster assembly protein SufD
LTSFDTENLDRLAATVPDWRSEQMHAAFRVFDALNEPTGVEEDWRYVDYQMPFADLGMVLDPGEGLDPGPFLTAVGESSGRVVIVDGHVVSVEASDINVLRIADMADDPGLRGSVPPDHNKLAAAHAAFATDGILVDVPANKVVDQPLMVDVHSVTPNSATFPHIVVRLGENAEASVLVVYRSAPGVSLLMVPEVDLSIGDGARLRYLTVQGLDHAANIVVHQRVHLGRDSTSRGG